MKGCARSCLTGLVGLIVMIGLFYLGFEQAGLPVNSRLGPAIGAGLLATMAISFLWSARGVMNDGRLLRLAREGVAPVDGQWAGFSGIIRSRAPIQSPISGRPAVAFKYQVHTRRGSGKNSTQIIYYRGTGLAPSTISTNLGTYKLLAVPQFDMATTDVSHEDAKRNIAAYVAATPFVTKVPGQAGHKALEEEWSDDDGMYRRDEELEAPEPNDNVRFDEQMIGQGQAVCVLGLYSQAKAGIVPDPNWANQTRVVIGDIEAAALAISRRARRYVITALILGAICAGITAKVIGGVL